MNGLFFCPSRKIFCRNNRTYRYKVLANYSNSKWGFMNWNKTGVPRTYEEAVKNASVYLLNNVITDKLKKTFDLKDGEAPCGSWMKEYNNHEHQDFYLAIYNRKMNYNDIVYAAGLIVVNRHGDWSDFDWSKMGIPRTYGAAVKNVSDYLLNNVMTDKFKKFFNLSEGEAPNSQWIYKYNSGQHRNFYRAIFNKKINYDDAINMAGLVVVNKYKDWSDFTWSKMSIPRTYGDAVKNASDYLLNNVMTDKFKDFFNLKVGDAPRIRWIKEYNNHEHQNFYLAIYNKKINYDDVVNMSGLVIVNKYKSWSDFAWSKMGNPRTYEMAVKNATRFLLENVMSNKFKKEYGIKDGYAPPTSLINNEFQKFYDAIYYHKINFKDIRNIAGLKRPPIYPNEYWRDTPIIGNLQKAKNFPIFLNHLRLVQKNLGFPDYIMDNYVNFPRISKFGNTLKNIDPKKIKYDFTKNLIDTGKIKVIFENCNIHMSVCYLIELSKNSVIRERYGQKAFVNPTTKKPYAHGSAGHDYVLSLQMEKDSNSIGGEIPIWEKHKNLYLTGHVDLIKIIKNSVFVIDYKPNETPILSLNTLRKSFINSIPQVGLYGLIIKRNLSVNELLCASFNKLGVWIYEPETLLHTIKDFLNKHNRPCQWEEFL